MTTTTTKQILDKFKSLVDEEKEYTRAELGKILTEIYNEINLEKKSSSLKYKTDKLSENKKKGLNNYQRYIAGRPDELKKHSARCLKYYDPEKVLVEVNGKYENDHEFREKKKQYNRERYHKKKAEKDKEVNK